MTLTGVTVSDPKLGSLVCTPPQPATLAPGAQMVCTGTHTLTQADIDAGRVDNTGTADSDQTAPTDAPNQVPVTQVPALTLVKQGAVDMTVVAPADRADAGDRIVYTLTATNVGNVTLTGVTVSDPKLGLLVVHAAAAGDAGAGRADGLHGQLHADAGGPEQRPGRQHGDG